MIGREPETVGEPALREREQRFTGCGPLPCRQLDIDSHEGLTANDTHAPTLPARFDRRREAGEELVERPDRSRPRERENDRSPAPTRLQSLAPHPLEFATDGARAQRQRRLLLDGTRDREHQRGGLAHAAAEVHGAGALGQALAQGLELQLDVGELLLGVLDRLVEDDLNQRHARKAERLQAELGWPWRMDVAIPGDRLLDSLRDARLDQCGIRARPRRDGGGDAHGNRRVLLLGHREIAPASENQGKNEQHP